MRASGVFPILLLFTLAGVAGAESAPDCHSFRTGDDLAVRFPLSDSLQDRIQEVRTTQDRSAAVIRSLHGVAVQDAKTGATTKLHFDAYVEDAQLSADHKTLRILLEDRTLITRTLGPPPSDKVEVLGKPGDRLMNARISDDGRWLSYALFPGSGPSENLNRVRALDPPGSDTAFAPHVSPAVFSPEGSWYASIDGNRLMLRASSGGFDSPIEVRNHYTPQKVVFDAGGRNLAILSNNENGSDSAVSVMQVPTGRVRSFTTAEHALDAKLSPDGTKLAIRLDSAVLVYDVGSGRLVQRFQSPRDPYCGSDVKDQSRCLQSVDDISFTPDGGGLQINLFREGARVLDLASGAVQSPAPGARVFRDLTDGKNEHRLFADLSSAWVDSRESVCPSTAIEVCSCHPPGYRASSRFVRDFTVNQLCARAGFDSDAWDAVTPTPAINPMPLEEAKRYLMRFQKPGGFDPARHLPVLLALLRSKKILDSQPDLVAGAMQVVLARSNALYRQLIDETPGLLTALKQASTNPARKPACRTRDEQAALRLAARQFLSYLGSRYERPFAPVFGGPDETPYVDALAPLLISPPGAVAASEDDVTPLASQVENLVCVTEARCQWSRDYRGLRAPGSYLDQLQRGR